MIAGAVTISTTLVDMDLHVNLVQLRIGSVAARQFVYVHMIRVLEFSYYKAACGSSTRLSCTMQLANVAGTRPHAAAQLWGVHTQLLTLATALSKPAFVSMRANIWEYHCTTVDII